MTFIEKIAPYTIKYKEQEGILASLTLAQAILESDSGKSELAVHTDIVERIEQIDQVLAKPKLVGQLFCKPVLTFETKGSLQQVLKAIHKQKYTQFLVYNERKQFQGRLTTVGITNWLATTMTGAKPYLPNHLPTLKDILHHEKTRKITNLLVAL